MYRKYLILVALVIMAAFGASPVMATDYYVSSSDEGTGCSGSNAGEIACPWNTIAEVNAQTFIAGDVIYFMRGDKWRIPEEETLIPDSGDATGDVTYTSYGTTGNKPLILGSVQKNDPDVITGDWSYLGSDQWATTDVSFTEDVGNIIFNNEAATGIKVWTSG